MTDEVSGKEMKVERLEVVSVYNYEIGDAFDQVGDMLLDGDLIRMCIYLWKLREVETAARNWRKEK